MRRPFARKIVETQPNVQKPLFELQHKSTAASLSCLRGHFSNMAPGTGKRAIRKRACHLSHVAYMYFHTTNLSLLWPLRCKNGAIMYLSHLSHKNTTSTDIEHRKLLPC